MILYVHSLLSTKNLAKPTTPTEMPTTPTAPATIPPTTTETTPASKLSF